MELLNIKPGDNYIIWLLSINLSKGEDTYKRENIKNFRHVTNQPQVKPFTKHSKKEV